jgi:hypothetical protein
MCWTGVRMLVGLLAVLTMPGAPRAAENGVFKPLPAEKSDYCVDEAMTWVKERLGPDTKMRTFMDKSGINEEKGVKGFHVIIWTDKCDGYFTMGFGTRGIPECTRPQYGERDTLLQMVGAQGDCRRFMSSGMEMLDHRQ